MKCPKCGQRMTMGSPHCEGYAYQWECHNCGKIVGVSREAGDAHEGDRPIEPYRYGSMKAPIYNGL